MKKAWLLAAVLQFFCLLITRALPTANTFPAAVCRRKDKIQARSLSQIAISDDAGLEQVETSGSFTVKLLAGGGS
jgi:hypothetical protein